MNARTAIIVAFLSAAMGLPGGVFSSAAELDAQAQDSGATNAIARRIGAIKTINGNTLTLAPDSGSDISVTVQPNARMLRIAPGAKDLKDATPLQLSDLQVGDTVRVRGYASSDAKSMNALEVVVITRAAVDAVRDQIRQDWQKRGSGGLVESVDAGTGTITLTVPGLLNKRTITVHTSKNTVVRRYAPDSAKPEDAKPATLQDVHVGDQLRARGERNSDGSEITAEEVYTGVFPKYVGTIKSVDVKSGILSLQDLATKKTVEVKVIADSQLHKIPAEMAQRFAQRLKATLPPGTPGSSAAGAPAKDAAAPPSSGAAPGGGGGFAAGMNPGGSGRAPDFQQMVSRLPTSSLADLNLQKGDAVVVLATEGTASSTPSAITLLSGVDPILQAAPSASQAMMLTPWSLGGAPSGDAGMQ